MCVVFLMLGLLAGCSDQLGSSTSALMGSATVCEVGCSYQRGYQWSCPITGTISKTAWCPPSNTCSEIEQCQANQLAACNASCAAECLPVFDGTVTCCDCPAIITDGGVTDGGSGGSADAGSGETDCDGTNVDICGCDNVVGSRKALDVCGVCGGDGTECKGCDGIAWSGKTYDACGVCGGSATDVDECGSCDVNPYYQSAYDVCGVCRGDASTCPGCDGVMGSGLAYDACGVCGGDGSDCPGCDGVIGSGLVFDACGVCGGTNFIFGRYFGLFCPPPPPPPPAREYVMSIYLLPADGADGAVSLVDDVAYRAPRTVLLALAKSIAIGSTHKALGMVRVGHEVGHAYVNFFSRNSDGTGYEQANPDIFPTGQTGDGGFWDYVKYGPGGVIFGIWPGKMNTTDEARVDIIRRMGAHGWPVFMNGVRVVRSTQLIGRVDFILSEATWKAVQERSKLHASHTASRYGLLLEPAKQSKQPGEEGGGEGAGCTSYASMLVTYSGAIKRTVLNPVWTRTLTFGERTIATGDYHWGSHIRPPWPVRNIRNKNWFLKDPAAAYISSWTYPNYPDWDRRLHSTTIVSNLEQQTNHRTITSYWYDPDKMYFWLRGVYEAARVAPGATFASLGRTWKAKTFASADQVFPHIETDARDAAAQSTLWDLAPDPNNTDWGNTKPYTGGQRIRLRDGAGCYVSARIDPWRPVTSEGEWDGPWEKFMVDKNPINSGDVISWWSWEDGAVTAVDGGGADIVHNRIDAGPWERWTIHKVDAAGQLLTGAIASGDRVALRASNGQWMVAEEQFPGRGVGGCGALNANRNTIGPWEIFTVKFHP